MAPDVHRLLKSFVIYLILFSSICSAFTQFVTLPFQSHRKTYSSVFATHENDVQVISNVFSKTACDLLHDLAEKHNERTNDGSSIFIRTPNNTLPYSPIEHAIDSFLTELGDASQKVEYWSRSEYINIDTHADIDERYLKDSGEIRCPKNGHVLYLTIKKDLRGPTCVFPNQKKGWSDDNGVSENTQLIVVPAVRGRVLRFPGSAMHAVPKPYNRWLLGRDEIKKLRQDEKCNELEVDDEWNEEDEYDLSEDEYQDEIERSVLLFNTWYDDEVGPKAVNGDYATGALPEGIELSEDEAEIFLQTEQSKLLKEWEMSVGAHGQRVRCKPKSEWIREDFMNSSQSLNDAKINVSLMSGTNRHSFHTNYVSLDCNFNALETALGDSVNVYQMNLSMRNKSEQ